MEGASMVQEVTTTSWGSRIISAFWGVLLGLALLIGSFILVFWNEGHSLHTAQSLQQTLHAVITVPNSPINPNNNLKVIYFNGLATTDDVLKEPLFHVSEKAIKLDRKVEMYQWKQSAETKTEKNMGGSETQVTNYTYNPVWSENLIDSSQFKDQTDHKNPTNMPLHSKIHYANKVTVGDFSLPVMLIKKIDGASKVDLSKIDTAALQKQLNQPIQSNGEDLYVGQNPESPTIGDLRISMSMVSPQTVSIIAQQFEQTLQPYIAPAGEFIMLLELGEQSPQHMIQIAESKNTMITWLLRAGSLLMMMIGIALLLKPIAILADVVPLLGSLVGFGTGLIAFLGGLMLWAIATAIAWLTMRPVWSVGLLIIVFIICYILFISKKKQLR